MSERFSDEVLQRAFLKTYAAWDRTTPASLLDALAAMRAVLEGQEDARIVALRRCMEFACACGDWFHSVEEFAEHVDVVHADNEDAGARDE